MLISDLVSLDANPSFEKTWAQVYLACCNTQTGGDCWRHCNGCCCHDVDFRHLRQALAGHVHALDSLPSAEKVQRAFWLMPEAYVAGLHFTHHCSGDVDSWLASKDPLGILALRLFFHELEALWTEDNKAQMDVREQRNAQRTWGMMQLALKFFSFHEIAASGWPVLNLAKALYTFFEIPLSVVQEQERLQNDASNDGRFFRLLWEHAPLKSRKAPKEENQRGRDLELQLLHVAPHVSLKLKPIAQIVQVQLRHDDLEVPSCRSSSLDDELSRILKEVLGEVPSLHHLMFNTFPVLALLDRLLLPTAAWVGFELCTPPMWRNGLAAYTAARLHASEDTGCAELQSLIYERDIACLVDVGAMFGACAAVAAHAFRATNRKVRVVAYEKSLSSVQILRRTASLGNLSVEAHAVCMVNTQKECWGCEVCHTLTEDYPFGSEGPIMLWMSQMSGPLQYILKGGAALFQKQLLHTVAVMTIPKEISGIKETLGSGYEFKLRWQNSSLHSTVLVVATARQV
ncbi:unnamed protein product [Durusdinium trenchii]|uniref:Uncharacterized protein n=2 Tax=Durusdinium trenchii TaxID=1381693 RepID=A0ABP0IKS7_9DINO